MPLSPVEYRKYVGCMASLLGRAENREQGVTLSLQHHPHPLHWEDMGPGVITNFRTINSNAIFNLILNGSYNHMQKTSYSEQFLSTAYPIENINNM